VPFSPSSKARLTAHDLARFPDGSLFHRIARAVCRAGCLPRKELYEAWETARRVRRVFRGGRIVDLAAGHGLLGHVLLILDDTSAQAVLVDEVQPPSSTRLHDVLAHDWPRLAGRVTFVAGPLDAVALHPSDVVVSNHACGALTDAVLSRATAVRARVAVLPCCHDRETCETGGLTGWLDDALAIDTVRAHTLRAGGYLVRTQTIPAAITPKNRLLLAEPLSAPLSASTASRP
jgi:hypothetical protein